MKHPYWAIFRRQTFTLFNLVNLVLALLIASTGAWQNLFFTGTVLTNWIIGMVQEIRARKALDKLALLHQDVYRTPQGGTITRSALKPGDQFVLEQGDQVPCDCTILTGQADCDESLQTGESEEITRGPGDILYSGTSLTAGRLVVRADKTGEDTFAAGLMRQARADKQFKSPLRDAIGLIVRVCTIAIVPCGIALYIRSVYVSHVPMDQAINSMAAALIGMIPQGLVVLTSIALALASMKLAKEQVLVQQLYCSETLARTDVLCLDKTGTLTQARMTLTRIVPAPGWTQEQVRQVLAGLYQVLPDSNATARAIRDACKDVTPCTFQVKEVMPFTSDTKYSGVLTTRGLWKTGAPSYLMQETEAQARWAARGFRVLALTLDDAPVADLLLQDPLKPDVQQTVTYFYRQDVQLKVISGDDPATVQAIANEAGISGSAVSMQSVPDDEIPALMRTHAIFGRVKPEQKKLMVQALQQQGHIVAMTGDGVNDVPALKAADCSIAMGGGSQAARAVSSMILLNDQFDDLPAIVVQGRRVINNIQRSASLFLVKTLFSFGLTVLTLVLLKVYPFEPVQLTLISALATGIPGFVLTLEPNEARVKGDFLRNVLSRALPGACNVLVLVLAAWLVGGTHGQFSTMCTILAGVNALSVLYFVCLPMTRIRLALVILMTVCFAGGCLLFRDLLYLVPLTGMQWGFTAALAIACPFVLGGLMKLVARFGQAEPVPVGK